jgi:hypothetical protein
MARQVGTNSAAATIHAPKMVCPVPRTSGVSGLAVFEKVDVALT